MSNSSKNEILIKNSPIGIPISIPQPSGKCSPISIPQLIEFQFPHRLQQTKSSFISEADIFGELRTLANKNGEQECLEYLQVKPQLASAKLISMLLRASAHKEIAKCEMFLNKLLKGEEIPLDDMSTLVSLSDAHAGECQTFLADKMVPTILQNGCIKTCQNVLVVFRCLSF